ncbi:MAG: BON domain-containing protein [Vicinamibacteria bacterium]|nr:BON domain-containing protein [Vicinamibacteria bacterium]
MGEGTLTAKIKSTMALDDNVSARAIDVDTSGTVVTLTGIVQSVDERERAVRLTRETQGGHTGDRPARGEGPVTGWMPMRRRSLAVGGPVGV